MRSLLSIVDLGLFNHLLTEAAAQNVGSAQIDLLPTEQGRKLLFQIEETEESGHVPWFELDQDIDVAFRIEVVPQYRAEKRKLTDAVAATERANGASGGWDTTGDQWSLP